VPGQTPKQILALALAAGLAAGCKTNDPYSCEAKT